MSSRVAKYGSVFNIGLQNTFVYRWNYFLRAAFGLIPLAGTVFLWRAVFNERSGGLVYTFVTLPPIALIFLYFHNYVAFPHDPMTYFLAIVSTMMAAFIQFFITYSLAMMAFWILEITTVVFIVYSFEYFLGGQM